MKRNVLSKCGVILALTLTLTSAAACGKEQETSTVAETVAETLAETKETEKNTETEASQETEQLQYGSVFTDLEADGNQIQVYYPTPNASESTGVKTTCTAPVFFVFGDGGFTQEEAAAYANESGLAALAAEQGSSVCFFNPKNGESWSAEDENVYAVAAQIISDSSTEVVVNGVVQGKDFESGEEKLSISGTAQRIYVYGTGTGADYIAANVLKKLEAETFWGGTADVTMAGCTLEDVSDIAGVEKNDIPVVSVGNTEEINSELEELCGSVQIEAKSDYTAQFASLIGQCRRQAGQLIPMINYQEAGIVEKIEFATVATTDDNASEAFKGTSEHEVSYVTYYAEDLDVENGKVPLVLCFHGGGNTALYEAMATEWPLIGKENGFITVSVDFHYPNCTAGEIVSLIEHLKDEYSIDASRIYASGFSMGGCKSWDLLEQYPEVFAGIAPMDASFEPGTDSFSNPVEKINTNTLIPVFYVGGETSPLSELPSQSETLCNRFAQIFAINGVKKTFDCEFSEAANWENPTLGINGDIVYEVTDKNTFTDSTLQIHLYQSQDEKYYTAMASASNQSHEVYARNSWAAWDFLSQFSRNEDGSILVANVTNSLASDDGAVTDNAYNQ